MKEQLNSTTLIKLETKQIVHANGISVFYISSAILDLDTDSSADEFEDASDFNACEEFFTDPPPVQSTTRHLSMNFCFVFMSFKNILNTFFLLLSCQQYGK